MVFIERRVTLDSGEVAAVVGHVERLLPLITSRRVPETMSDASICSKWWIVQLALEHSVCILCSALTRNFAVLDLNIIVLDFFLVTVF